MQDLKQIDFPNDYEQIIERMKAIDPIKYAQTRNYLNGQLTYLAPYISRGVITVKQVMETMIQKGYPFHACEKLIQELAWREYFQRVWQSKNELIWVDLKQDQQEVSHDKMIY